MFAYKISITLLYYCIHQNTKETNTEHGILDMQFIYIHEYIVTHINKLYINHKNYV